MSRVPARHPRLIEAEQRARLREFLRYDPLDELPSLDPPPTVTRPRTGLVIALTFLSAGAIAFAVLAISYAQMTSTNVALSAHERVLATLTEIDALLALRAPEVRAQLDAGAERLTLPDFAVLEASVARADALGPDGALDAARFRASLLADSARLAYERGPAALGSDRPSGGLLTGLTRTLTQQQRSLAGGLSAAGLLATVVLACMLLLAAPRRGWLALGIATLAAGALGASVGIVAGGLVGGLDAAPGTLRGEEVAVLRALLDIPLRNGLIAAGLGVALTVVGAVRRRVG